MMHDCRSWSRITWRTCSCLAHPARPSGSRSLCSWQLRSRSHQMRSWRASTSSGVCVCMCAVVVGWGILVPTLRVCQQQWRMQQVMRSNRITWLAAGRSALRSCSCYPPSHLCSLCMCASHGMLPACSECQLGMPARLNAVRLLDGRSSFGSTLSSVGTPSTRQQDLSIGDWPKDRYGAFCLLGSNVEEGSCCTTPVCGMA